MVERPKRHALRLQPGPTNLEAVIREIAKVDHHVYLGTHTIDRMEERGITRLDALRVLQRGTIEGAITPGRNPEEWKCKVVARLKGSREIGVVTIVVQERKLFVKTVEWEDLR